ncbi:MAG: peptidoglycan/LPS O-acetylase OafA/YrhL [Glaciecola sp.]|jgi:peptidoglycan/LPS O-acetylase OafA/YrhL
MAALLSTYTESRDNNFNLLRFLAAGLVLVAHSYPLTGTEGEPRFGGFTLGHVAVDIFFITSGFLVTRSLITRENVPAFTWARIVRIFPALIVAVLLCAFGVGLAFTSLSTGEFLGDSRVYTFIAKNSALVLGHIQYDLPGVFTNNPYPDAVNGSLWTLPWEIRMYAILGAIGILALLFRKDRRTPLLQLIVFCLGATALIATCINHYFPFLDNDSHGHGLRLMAFFFMGGAHYVIRNHFKLSHGQAAGIAFALAVGVLDDSKFFYLIYTTWLPYLILYLAYIPGGPLRLFNKLGDYSYGLYIYAFPVQQIVAHLKPGVGVWEMFCTATAATLILSIASWYLLEKPMLRKKDAYRRFVPAAWR